MALTWRMIRTLLRPYAGGLAVRVLIVAAVAATPYAFSFMGKWLVDEALQVGGAPQAETADEPSEADALLASEPAAGQNGAADTEHAATVPDALPPAIADVGEGEDSSTGLIVEWRPLSEDEKLRLLGIFLAASVGLHVLITGLSVLAELMNSRMIQGLAFTLRSSVYEKIQNSSTAFVGGQQLGQLMTRVLDDAGALPGLLINLVVNFFSQVMMLGLGVYLLFRLNPSMAVVVLFALPFYAAACLVFLPRIKRNTVRIRDRFAAMQNYLVQRLTNVVTVKNYAQEQRELAAFQETLDGNVALQRQQHNLNLYFNTLTTLVTGFATLAVLAFGFVNIRNQTMQLGEALAFYQVTAQLFVPISALVALTATVQTLDVHGERVYSILDAPSGLESDGEPVEPEEIVGEIAFRNVSLRYTEGGPFAVENVNLVIPAGRSVCIVGPTGSGKSTLIALLTRLYDPSEGAILLDGIDVRRFRPSSLRRAVGNVFREAQVFAGTLGENIALGNPNAREDAVQEAARLAELDEFALSLPDGYDTRVGPGGAALDAEQTAKLSLARALATHPAILAVDDVYSHVDEALERRLREAVRNKLAGRTILLATSRLTACEDADMVVVMRQGKVVQTGTHDDLLAVPGTYRRMYMRQMGIDDHLEEIAESENA